MERLIFLISFLLFSQYSAQNKVEKLGEITNEAIKLYVKDTLKRPFKYGDYIAISIFSDSTSNKIGLYIETLDKDFKLYKNAGNYQWFTFQNKNIIVFCDFNTVNKCQEYFKLLNFKIDKRNNTKLLDQAIYSDRLDENTRLWTIGINKDYKITYINGKIIDAEIVNPREFKKFLSKFSLLKMYQISKGGEIIDVKK
ncbi:hypothetical protein [Chryseobacterium sp. Mn2064]|uniref:hypothetical protein n=1 Tax=Chryseobacterium sp. Mn2064 TaxID=3395263 RepID=UPI003BC5FC13